MGEETKKTRVQINYKSGQHVLVACDALSIKRSGGTLTELAWEAMIPRPLHIAIDDIESIWELP